MKIALLGPVATEDLEDILGGAPPTHLPPGYRGAPFMATLIRALLERGHEVMACTTSAEMEPGESLGFRASGRRFSLVYCGARQHAFRPSRGRLGRALDFFALERATLRRVLVAGQPEVVHAHWSYEFGLAALESRIPHLVSCHDSPTLVLRYMPSLYRAARYLMARQCLRKARAVTAVSPFLQEQLQGQTAATIRVIPNPLPERVLSPDTDASPPTHRRGRTIAMVLNGWGRLKNPKSALSAFGLVRASFPDAELRTYGAGFGRGENAELFAVRHGLAAGVDFRGRVPHTTLLNELRRADVLVHPSLLESCPMGVAEAMAIGLPVVGGASSGGLPWVVGEGGLLVDVRSPAAIAEALTRLLGDADLRDRLSTAARARARGVFSPTAVVESYEREYRRVTAPDRSGDGESQ